MAGPQNSWQFVLPRKTKAFGIRFAKKGRSSQYVAYVSIEYIHSPFIQIFGQNNRSLHDIGAAHAASIALAMAPAPRQISVH